MEITNIIPIILITGIVQVLKEFGMPSKYAPAATFVVAVMFAFIFFYNLDLTKELVAILQFALGAIGLWEISKPTYKQITGKVNPQTES